MSTLRSRVPSLFQYFLFAILVFQCLMIPVMASQSNDIERQNSLEKRQTSSAYWLANIKRQGTVPYSSNSTYQIYRNVRDYGAKGDGVTDDTDSINSAIADGVRCGEGCDSSTLKIAVVYFPPGQYMISKPIIMWYHTQMIGDAISLPIIKAVPSFRGIAMLDADPYVENGYGRNWYTNQNNFWRQVRNFVLDLTLVPSNYGACIHWQVAQATSLQNIVFNMVDGGEENKQQGIFMDNGSGGMLSDLVFNGGNICAFMGNQQFTARNFTFNNCQTAIYQNWGWVWNYKSMTINNAEVGIDLTQGDGTKQAVGSVIVQDSIFNNVRRGIMTVFRNESTPITGGTLIIDNVDFTTTNVAVTYPNGTAILPGGSVVQSWMQGRVTSTYDGEVVRQNRTCYEPVPRSARIQTLAAPPPKPSALLDRKGNFVERSKPQYANVPLSRFVSVKDNGVKGDGITDDTRAIQAILNGFCNLEQVIYFDHGSYIITDTVQVPRNCRMTGEIWPIIMVKGSAFNDMSNPKVAWRVGTAGDIGNVEMSDIVFQLQGPGVGAILIEWNLENETPGSSGMWDVHWRIGGTAGTQLQSDICTKNPRVRAASNPQCWCAFLLLHITKSASLLMENNWGWVADHELDLEDHSQINLYNGRGVLIESTKPVWLYGTSFEHSVLYNYQIANAQNVYLSVIQSETAYMQSNPDSLDPFVPDTRYFDPDFSNCYQATCFKTLSLRIYKSNYIFSYGSGLYSFFNNYDQECLRNEACQENIVEVTQSEAIYLYALSTKASEFMVTVDNVGQAPAIGNGNTFCSTLALFEYP